MRTREYVVGTLRDYGLTAKKIRDRIPVSRQTPYNWDFVKRIPVFVLDELGIPYLPENVKLSARGGFAVPDGYVLKVRSAAHLETKSTPTAKDIIPGVPPIRESKSTLSELLRAVSDQILQQDEQIQRLLEDRDRLSSEVRELQSQVKILMELVESATAPLPPSPHLPPLPVAPTAAPEAPAVPVSPWATLRHVRVRNSAERAIRSFAQHEQDHILKKIREFDEPKSRKSHDVTWPEGGRFRTPGDSRDKCVYRVNREIRLVFAYDQTEDGARYELLDVVRRNDKRYYAKER